MGILDDLKHKAGELIGDARDKAEDLVGDVRERLGQHEGEQAPTGESEDVGPDSSSTDAVQPGYVTGEDEESGAGDADSSLTDDADAEVDDAEGAEDAVVEQEAFTTSVPDGATTTETDQPDLTGADPSDPDPSDTGLGETGLSDTVDAAGAEGVDRGPDAAGGADDVASVVDDPDDEQDGEQDGDAGLEPLATDVDPYDQPLSESIGDELSEADRAALARAVEDGPSQQGA